MCFVPHPVPPLPLTHCRRSCRPSFHTNGLFSSVTDSTGPLETREKRGGCRSQDTDTFLSPFHPLPSSPNLPPSQALSPLPECAPPTLPFRVTPLLEVLLAARLLTGHCQPPPLPIIAELCLHTHGWLLLSYARSGQSGCTSWSSSERL